MSDVNIDSNTKRINLDELRADMILAKDVINEWGGILLPKDTMLNDLNFSRLMSNGISYVYVKENSMNPDNPDLLEYYEESRKKITPTVSKETFIEFEKTYTENTEKLKESIIAISNGDIIDIERLYELTDGVMGKLKCKNDVLSYLNFIKATDEHTFAHSNNVALLCNLFGRWLEISPEELMNLTTAGVLHDLGKTKVNLDVLNKKGKLTALEFDHLKQHTVLGYKMLEDQNIDRDIKLSALMHHEKIDGSGYPLGLKDAEINKFAKIVAISDIYDAMTANRVYRQKLCPFEVIKQFEQQSFGVLDTKFILFFLQNIAYTYVGSWVELSNAALGEVVFVNRNNLSRPIVRTLEDDIIDLSTDKTLDIIRVI